MTWDIVVGIIALIGVFGTVGAWTAKLSSVISALNTTIGELKTTLSEFKTDNKATHKEFYEKLDDHETRITILEHKN